jgi:hippurate hydrolase
MSSAQAAFDPVSVDDMRRWRRAIHANPGLGFDVDATATMVAELLRDFGVDEIHAGVGRTGVVGVVRRGNGDRCIGIRADMDGLPIEEANAVAHRSTEPGKFHGCGHDGHTAMLLGAARRLASHGRFDGTVVLVFQPNEENGLGAQAMIDDGLFERFPMSSIYGLHNLPGLANGSFATRPGPFMSSEDLFEITVHGRGGHASAPEHHIDPFVVGAEIVLALQTIVSRSLAATDTAVVSVTEIATDGARNIVPSRMTIRGDCRSFQTQTQGLIERRIREIAAGIATAHGARATVEYRHEFVPLVNDAEAVQVAAGAASRAAGPGSVDTVHPPWPASEDFARFLEHVPGCFMLIGNGTTGGATLHNPSYDFNDEILRIGAAYWVELVHALL